jgi:succinate dehydrogenase / fumarate reductase, iron-sulfur subunit
MIMSESIDLVLHVWRQKNRDAGGSFVRYEVKGVSTHSSFLEMLDQLNEGLINKGEEPVAFDHDCREGICGACGMVVNGSPHGPEKLTTTCQLHMRKFKSGDELYVEPWRAKAFPVIRDLVVDRGALDRIVQAGGFIGARTGSAPDAHSILVPKEAADRAMDAAACIGCGACVAACPNAAAMLFTAAKAAHLNLLPQGQPEKTERVLGMVNQMESEGFGHCTNHYECMEACPKGIDVEFISKLNRDFVVASATAREEFKRRTT